EHAQLLRERDRVRRLHRPEAAVATTRIGRADRTAAGLGNRAEAGRTVRDGDAGRPTPLALHAHGVPGDVRVPPVKEGGHEIEQRELAAVARGELPDRKPGLLHSSRTPM